MMTNAELAILGLTAEKPCHGYEIEQSIEQRGMRQWTEIGFSSIYYILNKLEDCGWLSAEKLDPGDRPARKVYRLTSTGMQALGNAVCLRLASPRPQSGDFSLGLALLIVLPTGQARQALQQNLDGLSARLLQVQSKHLQDRSQGMPPHVEALFDHSLHMMRAEKNWLETFLASPYWTEPERGQSPC